MPDALPPIQDEPTRQEEDMLLKIGYAGILQQRWPFQPDNAACFNSENAYITSLEREYLEIPADLEFPNLQSDIPEKHHTRLEEIWKAVTRNHIEVHNSCKQLEEQWIKNIPPDPLDEQSAGLLEESDIKIRANLQNSIRAVISKAEEGSELRKWQRTEKALRKMVYERSKIYMLSLRLYYEMLLETYKPPATNKKEYVLPQDHPLRNEIANRNRYLRLIDATQSGISIGKAAHHMQKKGRMRKTTKKPYIIHGVDVTHAAILDVIPYTLEQGKSSLSVIMGIVGPVHDIIEDTDLSLEDLISNYIKRLADFYDSSLDPLIKSGFPEDPSRTRESIKRKVLNLIKDDILQTVKQILRILSNNCKLSQDERTTMARNCLAGKQLTNRLLEIRPEENRSWGLKKDDQIKTKTFSAFPEEEDADKGKTSAFLMRLNGLTTNKKVRQQALIFKLEDRANNLLDSRTAEKQKRVLRTTTSRIIAWAMLDHDNIKFPLYNALPRAIDIALKEYEKLASKNPELMEERDHHYVAQLTKWQTGVIRFEVPAKIKEVLDRNEALKTNQAA